MQLGQAEHVGAVHDQSVRVRNVEARFNDRRAHEHVELVVPKVDDHLFKLMLGEFAVCDAYPRLGHEFLNMGGDRGD